MPSNLQKMSLLEIRLLLNRLLGSTQRASGAFSLAQRRVMASGDYLGIPGCALCVRYCMLRPAPQQLEMVQQTISESKIYPQTPKERN